MSKKKAVLLSVQPKWCERIASGKKTVEVRKTAPQIATPFKCYIYCTKCRAGQPCLLHTAGNSLYFDTEYKPGDNLFGLYHEANGMVIGEFICNHVESFTTDYRANEEQTARLSKQSCVSLEVLIEYEYNSRCLFGWHISGLAIYDKPKPLSEFYKECAGLDNTGVCDECENAVGEECDCAVNGRLHLTRPPQSWCYVEVLA